ncbi:unnamed protein product [Lymnaea stagnalis]|uniref:Cadherin domain-containing protein n=1 Tax=Lymnaea stagnalis TaxID=6523 RepID=A0AAV2I040_LYMST
MWMSACWNVWIIVCLHLATQPADGALFTFSMFTPDTVTIPGTTNSFLKLNSKVNCDDPDPGDICTCQVDSNLIPFETFWLNSDDGYYVYYDATTPLVQGTTYRVRVACRENNRNMIYRRTLNVVVTTNSPPKFSNPATSTVTISAKSTPQFSQIDKAVYADPEHDAVTFTMTSNPNLGYFTVGAGDGVITAAVDMQTATSLTHTLTVSASDSYNTVSPAFTVYVIITDQNKAPQMTGLPTTVFLLEDSLAGGVIVGLGTMDDTSKGLSPTCSSTYSPDNVKFTYDSGSDSLVVKYDNAFDYETKSSFTITCTVTDGYLSSPGDDTLTLIITDVNEPPAFDKAEYYCALNEGAVGATSCSLNAVITDPEDVTVGSVFFLPDKDGKRFSYTQSSGIVTFSVNYDVDTGTLPTDANLTLAAVDSGGLTSTVTVVVHVNDINDNSCVTDSIKLFKADQFTPLSQIGTFSGADSDLTSPNNEVHFEVTSASPASASNHIYVARNGEIFYANKFDSADDGTSFNVYVRCVDAGSPRTTSTTTVVMTYSEVVTTSTTTASTTTVTTTTAAPEKDLWDYQEFKALFGTMMAVIGLAALLGIGWLCLKCLQSAACTNFQCCPQRPTPEPPRKIIPYKPPPPPSVIRTQPTINPNWENTAWSLNTGSGPLDNVHYYHYH